MIITALIENKANGNLMKEWGLCVHISYNGKNYLLDSGGSAKFMKNAGIMDIDLSKVDAAVLSHAHFDHSGGYEGFFESNNRAKLYLRKGSLENCYTKYGFVKLYVGLPRGIMDRYNHRILFVSGNYEIHPGVSLLPHTTKGLDAIGKGAHMYVKQGRKLVPDDFEHEQSLVFQGEDGLVILNSCSHGGVDTIIREVLKVFPDQRIKAVIGGFHLAGKPSRETAALGERLKQMNIGHIYTGHCTGNKAFKILQQILGDKISYFSTGTSLTL